MYFDGFWLSSPLNFTWHNLTSLHKGKWYTALNLRVTYTPKSLHFTKISSCCFFALLFISSFNHVFHSSLTTFTKHFVLLRIHKHASIEDTCLTFSRLLCLCETYNFFNWNLIFLSFCMKLNHYSFHLWCWFSKPQFKFTILIEYTICNMQTVLYSFFSIFSFSSSFSFFSFTSMLVK